MKGLVRAWGVLAVCLAWGAPLYAQTPVSSSVPVGVTARHKIYTAQNTATTLVAVVTDAGSVALTAEIFGTIPYGSAVSIPATLTLDLRNGGIDCGGVASAVTFNGRDQIIAPKDRQIFFNCTNAAGSVLGLIYATPDWFGVTPGDNQAPTTGQDDQPAVNAAIIAISATLGGTVELMPGTTYNIKAPPIVIDRNNLVLKGPRSAVVKHGGGIAATHIFASRATKTPAPATINHDIEFDGFTLDGNSANLTGSGDDPQLVRFGGVDRTNFHDMYFVNSWDVALTVRGNAVGGSSEIIFAHNTFKNIGVNTGGGATDVMNLSAGAGVIRNAVISGNVVSDSDHNPQGANCVLVEDNNAPLTDQHAVAVVGNSCENINANGVRVRGGQGVVVVGNTFRGAGQVGSSACVDVSNSPKTEVSGNNCYEAKAGVQVNQGSDYSKVNGNFINITGAGVGIILTVTGGTDSPDYISVSDNTIVLDNSSALGGIITGGGQRQSRSVIDHNKIYTVQAVGGSPGSLLNIGSIADDWLIEGNILTNLSGSSVTGMRTASGAMRLRFLDNREFTASAAITNTFASGTNLIESGTLIENTSNAISSYTLGGLTGATLAGAATPSTPAAGTMVLWADTTNKIIKAIDENGAITVMAPAIVPTIGNAAVWTGSSAATGLSSASVNYTAVQGPNTPVTTETQRTAVIATGGTSSHLYCAISATSGAGTGYTCRLRYSTDGGATFNNGNQTCTITHPSLNCQDLVNSDAHNAGDMVDISWTPNSSPASRLGYSSVVFSSTLPTQITVDNVQYMPTNSPNTCAAGLAGQTYFDTSLAELCFCNGTNWCKVSAPATCTSNVSCG